MVKILSIETSCDETAVSLLDITGPVEKPKVEILANSLFSQAHLHEEYGGVYPNLAKREHQKNLPILLEKTLRESAENIGNGGDSEGVGARLRVKPDAISSVVDTIDYIAVTEGPGLEPALWVGINFAEDLGRKWGKPVMPVNHMAGHVFSVLYESGSALELPALSLLVSGGHTELVHMETMGYFNIIGRTRDDAVGEAFDKVARMLGLPYPGGPEISKLAQASRERGEDKFDLPRPMINSRDLDFSFSGLKTAVLYKVKQEANLTQEFKEDMARAFEDAAVEVLLSKTRQALNSYPSKSLILGGGVAANTYLRAKLQELVSEFGETTLLIPERSLTTDNAVMIGIACYIDIKLGKERNPQVPLEARGNLKLA